tara:strand:- start:160 stop:4542 length:4383 start_codon:yes stop_codon:yes gene_type:complete
MADTAFERYLKDQADQGNIVKQEGTINNLDELRQSIQDLVIDTTEPKKPVKYFAESADPGAVLNLYYTLNPTRRLGQTIFTGEDPKESIKKIDVEEKDYISGLDEIAKGIDGGLYDLVHGVGSLLFTGTDLVANTDFLSDFEKLIEEREPERPETWRGDLVSLLVQYGTPGAGVQKVLSRIPAVVKMKKAANAVKGGRARKISQVSTRSAEGLALLGITDFIATEPGRASIFFEPENTENLSGREKAAAEFRNKIKYGAEGAIVGGGFPIVGKFTQLGYKYGLAPLVKTTAKIGAKTTDVLAFRPIELLLGNRLAAPLTTTIAKKTRDATKFTLTNVLAPTVISAMSKKVVRQLPEFDQWRLKSITSPDAVERNIKKLDNFLSFFRSYGKQPKDIEGISEQVSLYVKSRARKIDRTYEGLEKNAYALAKKFQNNYNEATTSPPMQKYFLDQVDEFLKGQRKLEDLPPELRNNAKDLASDIKKIMSQFKKVLPKGKQADGLAEELANLEINNINKYLVRSFQTFKNPEYTPKPEDMKKAVDYMVQKIIKKNPSLKESAKNTFKDLKPEEAYERSAKMHIEDILRMGKAEGKSPIKQLRDIGTKVLLSDKYKYLKTGEELPDAIKNLLGVERDLKASVAYTTAEAISSMANKRAADLIAKSGLENGWLFRNIEDATNAGFIGAKQIKEVPRLGIMKSELQDLFTSPEYVNMFQGVGNTLDKLVQMSIYRHALQAKVGVQIGKTLYSPQTQVRNVTSASFFALMNGHIGNKASVTDAMRMVARDIFKAGGNKIDEVEFNNYVEKLVRLGVWDENVVAAELKSVLQNIKDGSINTTDKLFDRLMKITPTDKVARLYAGGDNLWKQYGWEYGKSQLNQALKNVDEVAEWFRYMGKEFNPINPITGAKKTYDDAIEEASAFLLRNTYPTYSKVPPVIQELRKLPLGNFISFPAEILRTGVNIMNIGLKEAAHPNAAIRQMGLRRLAGAFFTSYAIGKGITETTQFLTNSTESQWDAYRRSSAAPWDKNSNLMAIETWKNGESAAINFSYFSPYDSLWKPMEAAIAQANNQKLNPEETEAFVMSVMFGEDGPVRAFLEPFISEPIGFDRFIDVTTRQGKKQQGGSVYTGSDDLADKFMKSFLYVADGVKPGILTSGEKIAGALGKDITKGGKPINLRDELLALFAGTRIIRIDVKKDLRYFTSTMNRLLRAVDETEGFYSAENFASKPPSDTIRQFEKMQEEAFRIQKDMFIRIKDLQLLDLSRNKIYEIMKASGTPKRTINNLLDGRFTPVNYSKIRFENKVRLVKDQMKRLGEDSEFIYTTNRSFLYPQNELEKVKSRYSRKKFFEETFNEETREFEGGYYPDREKYETDNRGNLKFDSQGKPIKEKGFIIRQIEKIPNILKSLTLPGAPGLSMKAPLPETPSVNPAVVQTNQQASVSQTGLTPSEQALLSPEEQAIRLRQRGMA